MLELRPAPVDCAARRKDTACATCGARVHSVCAALDPVDLDRLGALAHEAAFAPGEALIREGDPADGVFNITAGSVRVYRLLPDGRRQITGFLFAGDFLGLGREETHVFTAEAMEPVRTCRFRKSEYDALIAEVPKLERALFQCTTHELAAAQNQLLLLGRKTARERIASFLLDLPSHDPMREARPGHVRLPMTRTEIADYLGLTIETVSRELTKLKTAGVVRLLTVHELRIEQPETLRRIAEGEV